MNYKMIDFLKYYLRIVLGIIFLVVIVAFITLPYVL